MSGAMEDPQTPDDRRNGSAPCGAPGSRSLGAVPRFYCAEGPAPRDVGEAWTLPDSVAHHALRVLRLSSGDALALFSGTGGEYAATLVRADRKSAVVQIDAFIDVQRESPLATLLVQALAANDAMDFALRKSVEAGVTAIQPIVTQRSARMPDGERGDKRLAHWRQIAIAACEQCGRNRVPDVRRAVTLSHWLAARDGNVPGFVVAPDAKAALATVELDGAAVEFLIGPEGGFAPSEIDAARNGGMTPVRVGPRILRTETAGVAVLAVLQSRWGDWR
jgi:16S rRNA (uracil1498-N3)-methyltransferase